MSAEVVPLKHYRVTRNKDAALAAWAKELQEAMLANMEPKERAELLRRAHERVNLRRCAGGTA